MRARFARRLDGPACRRVAHRVPACPAPDTRHVCGVPERGRRGPRTRSASGVGGLVNLPGMRERRRRRSRARCSPGGCWRRRRRSRRHPPGGRERSAPLSVHRWAGGRQRHGVARVCRADRAHRTTAGYPSPSSARSSGRRSIVSTSNGLRKMRMGWANPTARYRAIASTTSSSEPPASSPRSSSWGR